jgi:uracil-DNA glycosylase
MRILEGVHPEWIDALGNVLEQITNIENSLWGQTFNPAPENIFKAFRNPLSKTSVVIFGQDPYPTPGHAMGLAFSVPDEARPIPKTLANIFRELQDDIGCANPSSGDLTPWADQGVALGNRILTTPQGQSAGHAKLNWQDVTNEVARVLGERQTVASLWGKHAQELSPYFSKELIISSPHPSPLSAHRGFFGSKPFSRTNQLLAITSRRAIDWALS